VNPNFFILGAPKCGTTSLARWLGDHPNIFMAPQKEPHFFNTDDRRGVATLVEYEDLFRNAQREHVAVGEASVWYLSSSQAVRNILQYNPNARFIVMVRNPIEMAPALHGEMLISGLECIKDFSRAWNAQEERRQGLHLPALSWTQRRFLYGDIVPSVPN
jgi:sulfotransferase family protein